MLSGERNENGKKNNNNNNRSNQQKSDFARAAHFFIVHFFGVVLHDYNVKLPSYTFYEGNVGRVLVQFFFFVAHFHPGGRQHPAATKFLDVPPTKNISFYFLSLALAPFLVELRWPVALISLFLCLSLSLYSKFVDMAINLSLKLKTTRIQKHFPLSVFVFIDSLGTVQ